MMMLDDDDYDGNVRIEHTVGFFFSVRFILFFTWSMLWNNGAKFCGIMSCSGGILRFSIMMMANVTDIRNGAKDEVELSNRINVGENNLN
jgi:hypothetical protein